ncbi:palmitoyl-monogalactosyldiacylglycerol delta-7 desaturase, chloroplastic-like [Cucurbita maxima]|uniref:Palmitoyl-monogalactosyldiacylglycerol delta-7 desaturase, chloroplastic-like n=1 Tax=Cucurbita maxima TaxID=3661 RepID=A0A6J1JGI0_CUCMA|nr:palmitoyl-monogalactosyldiacylglycerol delta-7 desaturase, chloroplastic-like [Cucurbita maxima]
MDVPIEPMDTAKPPRSSGKEEWAKIDKQKAIFIFLMHVLCIFAPFQVNSRAIRVALALHFITGFFGITLSYHRNLSHRSFKLPKWFEYLFALCGVHTLLGDPINWVSMHRYHHQVADTEKDPQRTPRRFLWLSNYFASTKRVGPRYLCILQGIEKNIFLMIRKFVKRDNVGDLENQSFYKFIHKTYLLHPIGLAILLYVVGGMPFLVWGMGVRTVLVLHLSLMVNTICHRFGKRSWKTNDSSRNNGLMGLISFGEGWHNNHHAFPYSARHGFEWWQIDTSWYAIRFLQAIGVATDVKLPPPQSRRTKSLIIDNQAFQH